MANQGRLVQLVRRHLSKGRQALQERQAETECRWRSASLERAVLAGPAAQVDSAVGEGPPGTPLAAMAPQETPVKEELLAVPAASSWSTTGTKNHHKKGGNKR